MALIKVQLFDGTRQPFRADRNVLVSIRDHRQKVTSRFIQSAGINFDVDFDDERPDHNNYAVLASCGSFSDTGFFPVKALERDDTIVDLMLRPSKPEFNFSAVTWDALTRWPDLQPFLAGDSEPAARISLESLKETKKSMACLLNIVAAIDLLPLPKDSRLLPLCKRIDLTAGSAAAKNGILQDRLFVWVDPKMKQILGDNRKIFERAPAALHPGADLSFKETRFGEANLQFSFHPGPAPHGEDWIKAEIDMDCYQDIGAHILLEVIPNEISKRLHRPRLTDPADIYALRWMAGRHDGEGKPPAPGDPVRPAFDPLYTLRA